GDGKTIMSGSVAQRAARGCHDVRKADHIDIVMDCKLAAIIAAGLAVRIAVESAQSVMERMGAGDQSHIVRIRPQKTAALDEREAFVVVVEHDGSDDGPPGRIGELDVGPDTAGV